MRPVTPTLAFKARLLSARFASAAEGIWRHLWPGLPVVLAFCAIGLLGGWRASPLWLHLIALLGILGVIGWTGWRVYAAFHWPSRSDALVRLERDSALAHQPLRKPESGPAHGDAVAQALWAAHLERLEAEKSKVRTPKPRLSWLALDRFAMTSAALLLLAFGLMHAGQRAPSLLAGSFLPDLGGSPSSAIVTLAATPPPYVGSPPLLLSAFDPAQIEAQELVLPAGTQLEITLEGGWRTPRLEMGGQSYPLEKTGDQQYSIDITAIPSDGLRVIQGSRTQFEWQSPFVTDQAPAIAFSDLPERTNNHALQITYEIFDDYGVDAAALSLTPQEAPEDIERYDIPTPNVEPNTLETRTVFKDLSPSKWAGRPVVLRLEARDGLKQTGQSGPLEIILPERPFEHPVARELVQQRKRLFFEAGSRLGVSNAVSELSRRPDGFREDLWVFSMMRSAHYRLARNSGQALLDQVADQLWAIATYIEDGGVSAEREALRESLEKMMSALENADTSAFDALAQDLQSKIADLMRKQMEQMQNQSPSPQMDGGEMRMIDSNTLERMMQQMKDLAAAGDMAGAMEMLQAIQSLMENLNSSGGPSAESLAQAQAAQDALDEMNALIGDQRDLMNQTVREALDNARQRGDEGQSQGEQGPEGQSGGQESGQSGPPAGSGGSQPGGQYGPLTQSQSGLQGRGEGIAKALGEAGLPGPEGLGSALGNMGDAAQRLSQGRGLPALRAQADALRNLGEAQNALENQVNQLMQQLRQQSAGRDPFGRANGNSPLSQGRVKIPTEAEAKRARAIRDELQRRLGDPSRPIIERSYLKRLLERFRP